VLELPGTLQAGLRQLCGSAATGLESASLSMCIDDSKTARVGADCQDKARSSSMCCSRSIVVVSLTFVKDDARGHGGVAGSGIAERDRQRRRVGVPILSERREPECRQNWGHRSSLRPPCAHGILGPTEQTFPLRIAPEHEDGFDARLRVISHPTTRITVEIRDFPRHLPQRVDDSSER